MNDTLTADLDSELHSSDLDSEIIGSSENQESHQNQDQVLAQQDLVHQALDSVDNFLRSEEFKKMVEENVQKSIQKIVPEITERLVQEEIKRLTE